MNLEDLPRAIPGYDLLTEIDTIKLVIWWAQTHDNRQAVDTAYLRSGYARLHRAVPVGGFTSYVSSLADRKPPHVLRVKEGLKLEQRILTAHNQKYGKRDATIHVEKLLTDLPQQLSNLQERAYLEECLICLRSRAYRATVVMAWNLGYDHLCYYILNDATRLTDFNTRMPIRYPGEKYPPVTKRETFMDMKESHVVEIASSANIISTNIARILREKLTRRNMAAHPADVTTLQPTAEEVIRDLIENVVLKLK